MDSPSHLSEYLCNLVLSLEPCGMYSQHTLLIYSRRKFYQSYFRKFEGMEERTIKEGIEAISQDWDLEGALYYEACN
jgi:hypothetical protein